MRAVTSAFSIGPGERAVLGHEILADVVEVGAGARGDDSQCTRIGTAQPRGISLGFCTAWSRSRPENAVCGGHRHRDEGSRG